MFRTLISHIFKTLPQRATQSCFIVSFSSLALEMAASSSISVSDLVPEEQKLNLLNDILDHSGFISEMGILQIAQVMTENMGPKFRASFSGAAVKQFHSMTTGTSSVQHGLLNLSVLKKWIRKLPLSDEIKEAWAHAAAHVASTRLSGSSSICTPVKKRQLSDGSELGDFPSQS